MVYPMKSTKDIRRVKRGITISNIERINKRKNNQINLNTRNMNTRRNWQGSEIIIMDQFSRSKYLKSKSIINRQETLGIWKNISDRPCQITNKILVIKKQKRNLGIMKIGILMKTLTEMRKVLIVKLKEITNLKIMIIGIDRIIEVKINMMIMDFMNMRNTRKRIREIIRMVNNTKKERKEKIIHLKNIGQKNNLQKERLKMIYLKEYLLPMNLQEKREQSNALFSRKKFT